MRIKLSTQIILSLVLGGFFTGVLEAQCVIRGTAGPVCASENITLSVANPVAGTYKWDFNGDGVFDKTGYSAVYRFTGTRRDTTYTVRLYRDNAVCATHNIAVLATPDAALGVAVDGGAVLEDRVIRLCTGTPSVNVSFYNPSNANPAGTTYTIDWGDAGGTQNYTAGSFNGSTLIKKTFSGFGFHPIEVTAKGSGSCNSNTETYQVYIGSNPSVGLGNPGNTVGLCAPVTLTFPITGTQNNPAGTEYRVYVSGKLVASYDQDNVPDFYTHTFTESSCGLTTTTGKYQNAFDLQVIASNPCGSSTATIEPIEVSEPSVPLFMILDSATCTGKGIVLQNASEINEVTSGNPSRCQSKLAASWSITPGTAGRDWVVLEGNLFNADRIKVDFNKPGEYMVTITLNSPSCGKLSYSETITVRTSSPTQVDVDASLDSDGGCAPGTIAFINRTSGDDLSYRWQVQGGTGSWSYAGNSKPNSAEPTFKIMKGGQYKFIMEAVNACTTVRWDTTLTFNGPPAVTLYPIPDACQSTELNFSKILVEYSENGSPIKEYYWEFPGATVSEAWEAYPKKVKYAGTGDYAYRVAATNECGTGTATDTLHVVEPSPVKMPVLGKICATSAPVRLEATPRGGIWSGKGVSANGIFRPSDAGVGRHTLQYRFGDGLCSTSGSLEVEVMTGPTAEAGPDRTACAGGTPFELGGVPAGGQWKGPDGVIPGGRLDLAQADPGQFRLYYSFTDAQGCVATDSMSLRIGVPPTVKADDISVCDQSGALSLPAGQPLGGVWSGPGVKNNTFDPRLAGGAGNYALTYTYTDPNGCAGQAGVTAKVIGAGTIDAGPDLTLCAGAKPVDLSKDAQPSGGRWRSSAGGLSGTMFDPSKVAPGEIVLTYEVSVSSCVLKDQRLVRVQASSSIDLSGIPTFFCDSESKVELKAIPAGGSWSSSNGGVVVDGNMFDVMASGRGDYELTYTLPGSSGCQTQAKLAVTVGNPPVVTVGDTIYCDGPDRLRLPPARPAGGVWSGPGIDGLYFNPRRAGGEGVYALHYTFTHGACSAMDTARVEVVSSVKVEAGSGDTLCLADGIVTLSPGSPLGGRWSGPGIVDDRLGRFDPEAAGEGVHTLIYTIGRSGCVSQDSMAVRVLVPDEVSAGLPLVFCPTDPAVQLLGGNPGGGQWSGPGVSNGWFSPSLAGPGVFELIYSLPDRVTGCVSRAKRKMTVHPRPRALFPAPTKACVGDAVTFTNDSQDATAYRWELGDGSISGLPMPTHKYEMGGTYTVTLITTNDFGCSDTLSRALKVARPPVAGFMPDKDRGCSDLTVRFFNKSSGDNLAYRWALPGGREATGPDPGPVVFSSVTADTSFVVTLSVQNQCATAVYRDTIRVFPLPKVDFGTQLDTSCSPMRVEFANRTTGRPDSFHWDLGNGAFSSDSLPPPQVYLTDSTVSVYTIRLVATNQCGTDSLSHKIVVKPLNVNAFFNLPSEQGCAPFTVALTNFSTRGAMVRWDFGDGDISSAVNPVHTFDSAGDYVIRQYADNGCGQDSAQQMVRVLPSPEVSFTHSKISCIGDEIKLENTSKGITGHTWRFSDGDSSQLFSPAHVFKKPGTYQIVLTGVSGANGCKAEARGEVTVFGKPDVVAFQPSERAGCMPLAVWFRPLADKGYHFQWDFGDGNTGVESNPRHIYEKAGNFRVRLTVVDSNGCSQDTSMANIQVHPKPTADFELEAEALCGLPATALLRNRSTGASGFQWDFGDGVRSTHNEPEQHIYQKGGHYEIFLAVANAFRCADTVSKAIEVFPPPVAHYEILDRKGCAPQQVRFANLSSANHYYWDFGDGNGSTQSDPVHVYRTPGRYDVRLIVSYNDICYDTLEFKGEVEVFPKPKADFVFEQDEAVAPGTINLFNRSEQATAWHWDFGDGAISLEENPRHRYLNNGTKTIRLEASNIYGCRDDTIRVIDPPLIKGLFIPNAFSPEAGIGEVRLFKPKGVGLKEYRLQVFSPYGQLVWETDRLENGQPADAWDGTLNGTILPQDVYVWKAFAIFEDGSVWRGMKMEGGGYKAIGSVTLLR